MVFPVIQLPDSRGHSLIPTAESNVGLRHVSNTVPTFGTSACVNYNHPVQSYVMYMNVMIFGKITFELGHTFF